MNRSIYFILLMVFAGISCSKSEDPAAAPATTPSIVGTWEQTTYEAVDCGPANFGPTDCATGGLCETWIITATHIGTFPYTISGSNITCANFTAEPIPFTVTATTLTMAFPFLSVSGCKNKKTYTRQ